VPVNRLHAVLGACLLAVMLGPAAVALSGPRDPAAAAPLLVIVPPWRDAGAVLTAVGGWAVGLEDAPLATLGTLPPGVPHDLLYRAGAWAVLDGAAVAALCGVSP
jgi:hypothetical protein